MKLRVLLVIFLAVVAGRLTAQTTGRIVGEAVDSAGQAVPGATVTIKSPSLQGTRSAATDAHGEFHFAFLPPGAYEVTIGLAGFKTVVISGVRLELDHTATVRGRMEIAAVRETVDVTAPPPEIDVTNVTTGLNATADLFTRMSFDRSFFAIARVAPGTQEDESGTAFYGSTGAENEYVIDGLNVTGTGYGGHGKELTFDFVEEVEVKTGGLPAEYGRTTGGILNVLTKSGGNEFHGSAFGFFAGGGLQSDDRTAERRPTDVTTVNHTASKYDFGASLGGRIVRDRLWFFSAFNRVVENSEIKVIRDLKSQGAPRVGSVVDGQARDNRFAGKLTWRPAPSSTLAVSVFSDPQRFAGPIGGINGPPSTYLGTLDTGGTNVTPRYEGTFGGSLLVHALFGSHHQAQVQGGPATDEPRFVDLTVDPPASRGGIGFFGEAISRRNVYKLDVAKFAKGHELKIGGDVEAMPSHGNRGFSGGDSVIKLTQDGQVFYSHFRFLDDQAPGFDLNDPSTWRGTSTFLGSTHTRNLSAYAQDAWQIQRGLTFNLGLRFERQDLQGRARRTAMSLDNWGPRAGAAWDVKQDGRSKLYTAFSRYFESIPWFIQVLSFPGPTSANSFNRDPTPGSFTPDSTVPLASAVNSSTSTAVDPGLKGQYVDEWMVGYERELRGDFLIGLKGNWRKLGRVVEDLTAGDGKYLFGNPGEGEGKTLAFFDGSSAPSPKARRVNYSVELTARKRLSHGWQLLASYVWTRLRGNYDGVFQRATGFSVSPNWTSGFDYADLMVNAEGPLTSESVHQCKLDGSYELGGKASGLNVGLSTHWYSGLPENAYGVSVWYLGAQYYLVPRGSVGRNPADFESDLHVNYPVRAGKTARINVQADVFNLFDRQAIVRYDERYNLIQDGRCSGVPEGICTEDGGLRTRPGTLQPLGVLGDVRRTATNPDYLKKGNTFTGRRSLRLGVRMTF
jgi:outer membrane receptor protein involved in Fe transport